MYEAFYGLRERPFNLTPDPKFLYLSDKHKEAFAHLLYGIKNRSGFVMLSGEIGTGKTTICRNLLNQLDDNTKVAFIFNPALNPIELMKKINQEFGVDASANTLLELVDALNHYLLESAAHGVNNVLVIDESQNLEPEVLEQIRLLSNLETETDKLLQIILIGQPELAEKLSLHRLRQLNQRITARYHLHELDATETMQYIAYRLHVAGGRRKVRFAKGAVSKIHNISGGTPRVINALCDRCLLIGYTKETHTITPAIVKLAAKEIKGEKIEKMGEKRGFWAKVNPWLPSPGLALTAIAIVLALQFFIRPLNELNFQLSTLKLGQNAEAPAENTTIPVEQNTKRLPTQETPDASGSTPNIAPASSNLAPNTHERYKHKSLTVDAARRPEDVPALSVLAALEPEAARKYAARALLHAWNLAPVHQLPANDEESELITFAQRSGLAAESLTPTLQQLRNINLPAFVQLEFEGAVKWFALIEADDEHVTLSSEMGAALNLSEKEFETAYAKRAVILWRDTKPETRVMLPGQENPSVEELKTQLRTLGRISADNTGSRYDEETATAVAQIQSETGLWVDSKAGKQVRMVLFSWLPDVETPKLGTRPAISAPVRHVSVRAPQPKAQVAAPAPMPAPKQVQAVSPQAPATPQWGARPRRIPAPSPYAPAPYAPTTPVPDIASAEPQESDAPKEIKFEALQTVEISLPLDAQIPDAAPADIAPESVALPLPEPPNGDDPMVIE